MSAQSIDVIRDAIQARLATLDEPLRAYDTFDEQMHAPVIVVVYPQPPQGGAFELGGPGACAYRYNFRLEVWSDAQAGVMRAQDRVDRYISPTDTHANSIESKLEDRTIDDSLTTYTTSVKVDAFDSYAMVEPQDGGRFIVATVPVEVYCDNA